MGEELKTAVFAGGCFWCTEAVFQRLRGVERVTPGFSGGTVPNPTTDQVYSGKTGHAESVKFEYNPDLITFNDLLTVFFATHDPTTLNRQQYDVGDMYRSTIFYANEEEKQEAQEFIDKLTNDKVFNDSIVTTLEPLRYFYEAENYHKDFYNRNKGYSYCQVIIDPKIAKLKEKFASLLKE